MKLKHRFAVILHDPDRDSYFPLKWLSSLSMQFIMSLMDYGIYHEILPKKVYYNNRVHYFSVPHGLYNGSNFEDEELSAYLKNLKKDFTVCSILGNIRKEKNYEMTILALQTCKNLHLVIAGKGASSNYTMSHLKKLAQLYNVNEKITWIDKYLTEAEMNSVLNHTDVLLLNYASSFKSQSGILNVAAPFAPLLLVSSTDSALYKICKRFNVAQFITPDSPNALMEKFLEWDKNKVAFITDWSEYKAFASWKHNIDITLKNFRKL
ncbi:MAG: glycosyltransferase [Winogradskyella sp.]|nr:glycosyltransferase [Winogradskyella sp.]